MARAFLGDEQVLLLDESSATLGPMAEYEVSEKLAGWALDRQALLNSHRVSKVQNDGPIILLSQCRIPEDVTL